MASSTRLLGILDALEKTYGATPKRWLRDPLHIALWENVAYLADDERREQAFEELRKRTGLDPDRIAAARSEELVAVCLLGGPHAEERAERLREAAEIALEHGGDLARVLAQGLDTARRELKRLPAIGAPGVDRILLFCGADPVLALESNGLRVLLRIGYGSESKSYATSYRSAVEAAGPEIPAETGARVRAWHLLRSHGQVTCRRSRPACAACPVRPECAYGSAAP